MFGGKFPTAPFTEIIESSARPFALDRAVESPSETAFGSDSSYEADATIADIYVFAPTERPSYVPEGERQAGALEGLCLPDADVQLDDRLEYGGGTFEVEAMTPIDTRGEVLAYKLTLDRVD